MMIDLLKKEDAELLNGTGVNSIKGLVPSATDYVPTDPLYDTLFEYMVDAQAQLETLDYDANGFVMHPLDYAKLLTYKTTTGEFNYPGLVFGGADRNLLTFNGTPIYKMSQITKGTALLGDWTRAELLIRKGINFGLFYEDSDNVQRNLVTLRIEEELALAVYHPQAFLDMDITPVTGGV
jgi:HK97 family phage major capsid protein